MRGLFTAAWLVLVSSSVVLAAPRAMQEHEHAHDHTDTTSCACRALDEEHPFSLDCYSDTIAASAATLRGCTVDAGAGCGDADGIETCQTAFYHVYYVHTACPHHTLSLDQEALVHTYEDSCSRCAVERPFQRSLPDCDVPTDSQCTAGTAPAEAKATLDTANTNDPSSVCADGNDATIDAWRTLLAYHDFCSHDALDEAIEIAVHTYEDQCGAKSCNTVDQTYDPSVCMEGAVGHGHDHDEPIDCDEHYHDHRRRLGAGHEEDRCVHTSVWVWLLAVVVILATGGAVFMKVKSLGCFAEDEKSSSG